LKIQFQEKPYDLLITAILASILVALVAISSTGIARILFGLLFVLFLPGYALIATLFPSKEDIDWIERIALSFGLSIAVVPLIGLLLNYTPWGIRPEPIVTSLFIFTLGMSGLAYWRRMEMPVEKRLSLHLEISKPNWKEYSILDKALTIGLVASIVIALGVLVYALTTPRIGERFTEFYILDANGKAENYPSDLNISENATVIIGVVNHEFEDVNYSVAIELVKVDFVYNSTSGKNDTVEVSRMRLNEFKVNLSHEGKWEGPYNFSVQEAGNFKLQFLLYKGEGKDEAYRSLHLWLKVK